MNTRRNRRKSPLYADLTRIHAKNPLTRDSTTAKPLSFHSFSRNTIGTSLYAVEVCLCSHRTLHSWQTPTITPALALSEKAYISSQKKVLLADLKRNYGTVRIERKKSEEDGWYTPYLEGKKINSTGMVSRSLAINMFLVLL